MHCVYTIVYSDYFFKYSLKGCCLFGFSCSVLFLLLFCFIPLTHLPNSWQIHIQWTGSRSIVFVFSSLFSSFISYTWKALLNDINLQILLFSALCLQHQVHMHLYDSTPIFPWYDSFLFFFFFFFFDISTIWTIAQTCTPTPTHLQFVKIYGDRWENKFCDFYSHFSFSPVYICFIFVVKL